MVEEGIVDLPYGEGRHAPSRMEAAGGSTGAVLTETEGLLTHRWRKTDSNHQSFSG
jgi:hypothetical protein